MADDFGKCTVTVWPTIVVDGAGEPVKRWHWKRIVADGEPLEGAQVDGSGAQRNGLQSKRAAVEFVKGKYPDDKITA